MERLIIKKLCKKINTEKFTIKEGYLDSIFSMFPLNSLIVHGSSVREMSINDGPVLWSIVDLQRQLFLEKFFSRYKFTIPVDLTAIDSVSFISGNNRFNYVAITSSLSVVSIFKVGLRDDILIPTLSKILPGFTWCERECWDMFGLIFMGHRDLRRLLTDYGFRGFPLRKDFPVVGFFEVCYDEELGQLINVPISLAQEMRVFDYTEYKNEK
jgi:NADH-quinone oxidoreductase subunit C